MIPLPNTAIPNISLNVSKIAEDGIYYTKWMGFADK